MLHSFCISILIGRSYAVCSYTDTKQSKIIVALAFDADEERRIAADIYGLLTL